LDNLISNANLKYSEEERKIRFSQPFATLFEGNKERSYSLDDDSQSPHSSVGISHSYRIDFPGPLSIPDQTDAGAGWNALCRVI